MNVFDQMLSQYKAQSTDELLNATHQVMQQITLAALYRAGFFSQAAFYGGTCLRIFYGLPRFSEDMDFSLLQPERTFKLENYFSAITEEFETLGRKVIITKKEKKSASQVESAFLKDTTAVYDLKFTTDRSIKIKIEVDINPPLGFITEHKLLLLPFSFMTRCYSLSDLYAGKMHAFLFRNWKNRVKGRDWFDFEWFVRHNTVFNLEHFNQRAMQTGLAGEEQLSTRQFKAMLIEKIRQTNIDHVLADVRPFVQRPEALAIWSTDYFIQLVELMRFE
jgi:predicted nucleotidyltransferase component of viral defense system